MIEKTQTARWDGRHFDAIEAAVMETERGRWFLSEYRRRHRAADTQTILQAIRNLESKLKSSPAKGGRRGALVIKGKVPLRKGGKGTEVANATAALPTDNRQSASGPPAPATFETLLAGSAKPVARLSPENLKYFDRDEDIFSAPPPPSTGGTTKGNILSNGKAGLPPFLVPSNPKQSAQAKPSLSARLRAAGGGRGHKIDEIVKKRIVVRTASGALAIPLSEDDAAAISKAG